MSWDPRKDNWLAGFTDGEGCFQIARRLNRAKQWEGWVPRFDIGLRADDAAVLELLQKSFGGNLHFRRGGGDLPACYWHVSAKQDLIKLVAYFDRFPLRAKKARDYAIWRQAVSIYCVACGSDARLAVLKDALRTGRAFDAPGMDAPDPDDPFEVQLALGL